MSETTSQSSTGAPSAASSRPRIFAATFVSELAVGANVGGVGSLIALLARTFGVEINDFAILGSFLGLGMMLFSLISRWLLEFTAGTILRLASYMVILGATGLAFAPFRWLIILSGLFTGLGSSLVILIVPAVLAGPRRARDIALANGASSAASVVTPLVYGFIDSIPGFQGRWAALIMTFPAIFVLATIKNVDFVNTPSAYAERWKGRRGRKRRKDFSDTFGEVGTVQAFGGPENVADDELARATMATSASNVHIPDLTVSEYVPASEAPNINHWLQFNRIFIGSFRVFLSLLPEFALYTWGVARLVQINVPVATAASLGAVFPLGVAIGRLSASFLIRWRYILSASVVATIVGTAIVSLGVNTPQLVAGLIIAGMGTALLYPITVDDLVALPGISANQAAAYSSLGGGAAVFLLPVILPLVQKTLSTGHSLLLLIPMVILMYALPNGRKYQPLPDRDAEH
ncbi:hypothetical protein BSR29_05430 [Boudabousia liubingyangii]|uniref:MFS transporter n=1 Tax=Boudabousia liubingyangii TaxID=1921764 RepID=A0A1Q5PLI9_9ACTO|nr:MFS transporter [Boudabousia liubingyangii]OKL46967.1 hypothetical protein BSR28_05985 [Boudabousia liubingyangii]OKL47925.1 hypothetical protein BSR29_05430 [Boudabousia liubingyangii]